MKKLDLGFRVAHLVKDPVLVCALLENANVTYTCVIVIYVYMLGAKRMPFTKFLDRGGKVMHTKCKDIFLIDHKALCQGPSPGKKIPFHFVHPTGQCINF